ncbi:MAG: assimilatory nitrite reductase small subunit [Rhodoferax sp.]|nr:assimilatory nitrite reductase small subunit [Rhodoferax sp.]
MSEWKMICRVDDIPVLGSRRVQRAQGMDVAVFRNDQDEVFALLDRCPHKGGPLSQGIVFGNSVACPLHNWTIALADGKVREPDAGCVQRFQVKLDKGCVHLSPAELASIGLEWTAPVAGPQKRDLPAAEDAMTATALSPLPQAGEG